MAIIPPPTPSEHKILHFKSIGDNLTEEEYNGIVSLLRHFNKHTESFRINETVTGEYGDYLFDLEDVTFLDNGILVSEDTILAEPKVKLTNADFKNSKYILQLKVLHYSDVNILEDMSITDYKVIETIEVELTEDVWVDIPLTGLEEDYIILYDGNILISHDNTIVTGVWVDDVDLSVDETTVDVGDTITLTAVVKNNQGQTASNIPVKFYIGNTLIDTDYTDTSGVASVSYTAVNSGVFSLTATANSLESNAVEITVEGVVPASMSLVSNKDTLSYADGDSATLTATVLGSDSQPYEGATVVFKAYKGGTLVETIGSDTTDASGVATAYYSSKGSGDLNIKASVGSIVSEIFVEDCLRYSATEYSSQSNVNWEVPSQFQMSFILNSNNQTSNNAPYFRFNNGSANLFCGKTGSSSRDMNLYNGENHVLHQIPVSTDIEYTLTYDNGSATLTSGADTVTASISISKIYQINASSNGKIKNIKIKPL